MNKEKYIENTYSIAEDMFYIWIIVRKHIDNIVLKVKDLISK